MKRKPSEIMADFSKEDHEKELKAAEEAVKAAQAKLDELKAKNPAPGAEGQGS